jgi:Ferritin-like
MTVQQGKADMLEWLQKAFELEWSTIPPYMMALLSIQRAKSRVPAELIRTVMIEEMLHLALAGNLISSLSGKVRVGPKNIPSYPLTMKFQDKPFKDREFAVDLAAFSPATVEIFLKIELPENWAEHEVQILGEIEVPALTIGEFYRRILQMLRELCDAYGEGAVFTGREEEQVGPGYYWSSGGTPIIIRNLANAAEAIDEIVTQGEGAQVSPHGETTIGKEIPHFFRFREIKAARFYRPEDPPRAEPSGDPFEVDYTAVYPILKNPTSGAYAAGTPLAELNDTFNRAYTLMLTEIAGAFNGAPRTLYSAIMNGMHTLTSTAEQMIRIPVPGRADGATGAPSFEWLEP